MQKPSYKSILKALSLFTGVQGLSILLNIARAKLAAVLLGTEGIGLNSIYNETKELVHETSNLGLDKSGVREIARAYGERYLPGGQEKLREAIMLTRSWVMMLSLLGTLLTLALANPLSHIFFKDDAHGWGYMLLAPAVGLSTLTCGELTVLRAIHKLRTIALVSVLHVVVGIISTIPIYFYWGIKGVVPAIVVMAILMLIVTIYYSYRQHRPEFCFQRKFLKGGKTMLLIGFSFVLSGIITHLARLAVQGYLSNVSTLDMVGLYSSIITIMTYVNIIFSSLEADYFPRLSEVFDNKDVRQATVSRQATITMMVMMPCMVGLTFILPILVPLILSAEFIDIVPATQLVATSLICRSLYLPTSYMPLSAGDSKTFFMMQTISYACFVPAIIYGYEAFGLFGIGIGLTISNAFDLLCGLLCARIRYGYIPEKNIVTRFAIILSVCILAYITTCQLSGISYWVVGSIFTLATILISFWQIRKVIKS